MKIIDRFRARRKLEQLAINRDYDSVRMIILDYIGQFKADVWLTKYVHRNQDHWVN